MIQVLTPGTPGSVWTKEETEIVRRKVIELMRYSNWSPDTRDGLFWKDGTLDGSRGISWVEDKWCKVRSLFRLVHFAERGHSKNEDFQTSLLRGKSEACTRKFYIYFTGLCLGQEGYRQEPDAKHSQAP